MSNSQLAKYLHITPATVSKWRNRFIERGLEGLLDEPRPGAPRTVTDEQVEAVVTKRLESMPDQGTHWSTRLMAQESGLSRNRILRIWHTFGLQPHRVGKEPRFLVTFRSVICSDSTALVV